MWFSDTLTARLADGAPLIRPSGQAHGHVKAAVRATAAGEAQIAPAIVRRMVEEFVRRPPPGITRA